MPLKKCYSSPHLSQLVKAVQKESPRKAVPKPNRSAVPKHNGKLNGLAKASLKKCFSSPHLKDLDQLEPKTKSTDKQSRSAESSAFRNEVINCRFRSCGCTVRLSRERMDSHLRTNAATHSLLILNKIDELGRRNEQICKRLLSVENSMVSMMNLFENLQDVLASKGIPAKQYAKASRIEKSKSVPVPDLSFGLTSGQMDSLPAAIAVSPEDTKMSVESQNHHNDNTHKRLPDHLDLAVSQPPVKRQRSTSTPVQPHQAKYPMTATGMPAQMQNIPKAPQYPGASQTNQHLYSQSVSMATNSMGVALSTPMNHQVGFHSSSDGQSSNGISAAQYAMMAASLGHGIDTSQLIDSASLRAQTQQAAKRVQDLVDGKGKVTSKRKVRGRVKKGKNLFEAPKKPKTAYNYYQIGVRESILAEITADASTSKEVQSQKVARIIGERWKSMPEHEREAFNNLAMQDKQRYKRELEEYVQLKAQLKEACKAVATPMVGGDPRLQNHQLMMGGQMNHLARVNYALNPLSMASAAETVSASLPSN